MYGSLERRNLKLKRILAAVQYSKLPNYVQIVIQMHLTTARAMHVQYRQCDNAKYVSGAVHVSQLTIMVHLRNTCT